MADTKIRVLSLNVWGLKYVSKDRHERIAAIANVLAHSDYDIVALQEIWVNADYEHVRQSIAHRLPYTKLFHSGALGAGLAIFTRWPIVATSISPYSLNGEPVNVLEGDWFVGKGAASVVVVHPILGQVQIFNTHFSAIGGEEGPEYNRTHRIVNAWEISKLARTGAELGRYIIACGDFNSIPDSLPMTIIREHTGLTDAWAATHSHIPPPTGLITPVDGVVQYGITADSPLNSYREDRENQSNIVRKYQGKRLDYVLFGQPLGNTEGRDLPRLSCSDCKVAFTERVPGVTCSYSDHFGTEATLTIHTSAQADQEEPATVKHQTSWSALSPSSLSTILLALTASYRLSRERSNKELVRFALCIVALLGLMTGSAFVPVPFFNPLFIFATIFLSWFATTYLYEGFIYGNWELKAILNVIEELELYRDNMKTETSNLQGDGQR